MAQKSKQNVKTKRKVGRPKKETKNNTIAKTSKIPKPLKMPKMPKISKLPKTETELIIQTKQELTQVEKFYIEQNISKGEAKLAQEIKCPIDLVRQHLQTIPSAKDYRLAGMVVNDGTVVMTPEASEDGDEINKEKISNDIWSTKGDRYSKCKP